MASARFSTAGDLIGDAAVELNLTRPTFIYASTDQNVVLLRALLNSSGKKLLRMRPWFGSTRQALITITAGDSGVYALPSDFISLSPQTLWNVSQPAPAAGPLTGPQWVEMMARTTGNAIVRVPWRIVGQTFEVWPQPVVTDAELLVEYLSRSWVKPATSVEPDSDAATAETDLVMLEAGMVQDLLKLRWKQAKGKDSTAELAEFEMSYAAAAGADPAPILDLNSRGGGERFIDGWNVPDTGWGLP